MLLTFVSMISVFVAWDMSFATLRGPRAADDAERLAGPGAVDQHIVSLEHELL